MKEKKKGICHECLERFEYKALYCFSIAESSRGPAHSIGLCKECANTRGEDPDKMETIHEQGTRFNKSLGLT